MKKSMKTKLAMFAVAGAMAVSGTVGIAAPAKAGNTTNDEFKYNRGSNYKKAFVDLNITVIRQLE